MKIPLITFVILVLCLNVTVIKAQNQIREIEDRDNGTINSGFRNYEEVISKNAETQNGLFTFHKVGSKYFFEIPGSLLEKEILVATKVSGHASPKGLGAGSQPRSQQIIRFQKKDKFLLMRLVTYNAVADKALPIHKSVKNNNFETVVSRFKIEAHGKDKDSYIIKVNDFFTSNIPIIGGWQDYEKKLYGISSVDASRSYIEWIKTFPENVEVRHVLTYMGSNLPDSRDAISLELNQSFILLPERPMVPREFDERIGYFSVKHIDYGLDEQRAAIAKYILRWRLEPSDQSAFEQGELVAPVKPIVYYLEPATPEKWKKYIKQGVEEWQKAFEKIGFKNAIVAKDPPTSEEDPDWFPEDIRNSMIRFGARLNHGATGQNIHDPRTGEILQGNILFNHNFMNTLRNFYFVRTAATNPDARPSKLKEEVMGRLIRTVVTHEVGHTLGLMHNSVSLASYPVDSLRSPTFTSKYGTGESVMNFMFNYIAQPEDGVTHFFNKLGAYDHWAIEYGYKPIIGDKNFEEERYILNQLIREKLSKPMYKYGNSPTLLGGDQLRSGELSIQNLKHIMTGIIDWSIEEEQGYRLLKERYKEVNLEFESIIHTIGNNVGGTHFANNMISQNEYDDNKSDTFDRQKETVGFLNRQLFKTPSWLLNKEVIGLTGPNNRLGYFQNRILNTLLKDSSKRILENVVLDEPEDYSVIDLYTDVQKGIFEEVKKGKAIDPFRRNLQKTMVNLLGKLLESEDNLIQNTDLPAIARANLITLSQEIKAGIPRQTDKISIYHLQDMEVRIEGYLHQN